TTTRQRPSGRSRSSFSSRFATSAAARSRRVSSRARTFCEPGVDELDSHGSFADGRGAALGRAGADVAGGEDARDAGLEQVLAVRRGAGEDEAVLVAGDRVV